MNTRKSTNIATTSSLVSARRPQPTTTKGNLVNTQTGREPMNHTGEKTMKTSTLSILSAVAALSLATVSQGAILYQGDFTGTTLAEAGLATVNTAGGFWESPANDRVQANVPSGNSRASVYTTDSWQNDAGFTLDVTFNQIAAGTRFAFGIVTDTFSPNATTWVNSAGAYGIGLATTGELSSPDSLIFNNGSSGSQLSSAQGDITFNTLQTLSLKVTADSWSYSLNGAPATTGSFTFDTSRSYRFIANAQRGNPSLNGSYFTNITLTAVVPEPSTLALLGVGLLGLCMRGRYRRQR